VTTSIKTLALVPLVAMLSAGCGEMSRQGRSPAQVVIQSLQGASGATPGTFGNPVLSDVETLLTTPAPCTPDTPCPTFFNDLGQVTMTLVLKDPGQSGSPAAPSELNQVTFTRYRVSYRRSDGRNTPGVDVPFPIDSAVTFTVPPSGQTTAAFELVRNLAKRESPLLALRTNGTIINAVADVSFFGRDQAGNDVTATGSLAVNFGNFADRQ
jgi:hypothetical protein